MTCSGTWKEVRRKKKNTVLKEVLVFRNIHRMTVCLPYVCDIPYLAFLQCLGILILVKMWTKISNYLLFFYQVLLWTKFCVPSNIFDVLMIHHHWCSVCVYSSFRKRDKCWILSQISVPIKKNSEIGIVLWFTAHSMLQKFGKIVTKQLTSDHRHITTEAAHIPNKCMERNQQVFIT
jgi:hypothetical protein